MDETPASDPGPARARDRVRIGLAVGGAVLPPLADLAWSGWQRVFGYLAPDAFTYLTVARNVAHGRGPSFDGEFATNGFHPLWQAATAGLYALCDALGLGEPAFLVAVVLCGVALLGVATALLGDAFRLALGRVPAAFPLLPLGLYPLCAASFGPRFGSLWSFANGMESGVALAAAAWALRGMVQLGRGRGSPLAVGAALALLALARLDHALFAPCAVAALAWLAPRRPGTRALAALAAPVVLALAAYLAFNALATGALLPVSGALKSSFPHPSATNARYLERILFAPDAAHPGELWRMAQLLLPALVAAALLPWIATLRARGRADALAAPLGAGALFALGLAAYDFLFVGLWHQGHWYFPVSIVWTTLAALYLWEVERPTGDGAAAHAVSAAAAAAALLFFAGVFRDPAAGAHYRALYEARAALSARFAGDAPRIVEYDDGIVAFATGFPALSGLGLGADPEALPWVRSGRLLWLAWERGFDHLASLNYLGTGGLDERSSSDEIRAVLNDTFFLSPEATAPFDFRVVHVAEDASLAFVRFALRRCPPEPAFRACASGLASR